VRRLKPSGFCGEFRSPACAGLFAFYAFGKDLDPFGTWVVRQARGLRISEAYEDYFLIPVDRLSFPVARADWCQVPPAQIQLSFSPAASGGTKPGPGLCVEHLMHRTIVEQKPNARAGRIRFSNGLFPPTVIGRAPRVRNSLGPVFVILSEDRELYVSNFMVVWYGHDIPYSYWPTDRESCLGRCVAE